MEQKSFADIFEDVTKQAVKIQKKDYLPTGRYPIIDQGQEWCAGYTDREDGLFQDVPAYIFGDHTRIIKYTDEPFYLGADGVKLLKLREGIQANPRFFYYALKSQRIPDTGYNRHFKWLKESLYHVPTLNEQTHIADTLDTLSTLITLCKTKIFLFDELVKSRFVEMFGDPVTNPMGWKIGTIGEIATDVKYGTSAKASDTGKYKYLRMNNLTYDGGLDLSDLKYIDVSDDELEKYVVRKGDILFNRTNSTELVGKTALFDFDEDMVIAGYIIRVRLQKKISPVFFTRFMNLEQMKTQLRTMAKGAVNQANINVQEMKSIKVYLPPLALQNEFAAFAQQADKSKLVLRQLLEKQCTLKAALMQEYFAAK